MIKGFLGQLGRRRGGGAPDGWRRGGRRPCLFVLTGVSSRLDTALVLELGAQRGLL